MKVNPHHLSPKDGAVLQSTVVVDVSQHHGQNEWFQLVSSDTSVVLMHCVASHHDVITCLLCSIDIKLLAVNILLLCLLFPRKYLKYHRVSISGFSKCRGL